MSEQEEKQWGMLAHIIPLAAYMVSSLGWVAALVIYFAYKDKSKFVAFHALQQLYFMGLNWIIMIVGVVLFFTVVGIPIAILLWIAAGLASIIGPIYAGIKANNGEWWEYPVVGGMARATVSP